jgi:flavorubredoxin/flavin reductase (DIM6/NTAB) family NADH-FMN oxidoreductase RutF
MKLAFIKQRPHAGGALHPTRPFGLCSHLRPFKLIWEGSLESPHAIIKDYGIERTEEEVGNASLGINSRRLQTVVADVALDTVTIRSLDWDRDRFDIEFGLQNGTTYNSYLIFGKEKTALVDASHAKFRAPYMKALAEELRRHGRNGIDYLLVSHTEPDHSGLVKDVVAAYPDTCQVVGSKLAIAFLQNLVHEPALNSRVVKGGDKIDLGGGHVVEFVMAPNLHWPDTMFSFDHATGVLFTCDAFGMHYCSDDPYDTDLTPLEAHYRFYYDCLMRPNAKSVTTALRKIKDLPVTMIANGHGPMLRFNVTELVSRYQTWSEAVGKAPTSVAIIYSAEYGYSDRLSQTLARGITKVDGVATEMVDLLSTDPQELAEVVGRSSAIVLMSPPKTPEVSAALGICVSAVKPGKHTSLLIAESFGGNDEPVDSLLAAFVGAGLESAACADPLRVRDTPTEKTYQLFEESGTDMAQALVQKDTIAKKKAAMPTATARALARVSGGLYIVTAAGSGSSSGSAARSAMVASWVAQASFEPPGLTIAVAKDRAIESLMQVGDRFVLNCLGEESGSRLMKHFLQRFAPGEDRFVGVDWTPANGSGGAPVLQDAIAYVECQVVSRMETADHWVTYAHVISGELLRMEQQTAVHRRKVANYY